MRSASDSARVDPVGPLGLAPELPALTLNKLIALEHGRTSLLEDIKSKLLVVFC